MDEYEMRTGRSSGLGKLTYEVKCLLPEETGEVLGALAVLGGISKGEYIRHVLMAHVHGEHMLLKLRQGGALPKAEIGQE